MEQADLDYFERRLREEREAARSAKGAAAETHLELAKRYESVLEAYRPLIQRNRSGISA